MKKKIRCKLGIHKRVRYNAGTEDLPITVNTCKLCELSYYNNKPIDHEMDVGDWWKTNDRFPLFKK